MISCGPRVPAWGAFVRLRHPKPFTFPAALFPGFMAPVFVLLYLSLGFDTFQQLGLLAPDFGDGVGGAF